MAYSLKQINDAVRTDPQGFAQGFTLSVSNCIIYAWFVSRFRYFNIQKVGFTYSPQKKRKRKKL